MAFYLVHGGSKIYIVNVSGTATERTLPGDVTLQARPMRAAVLGQETAIVNSPNIDLALSGLGNLRRLNTQAPTSAPVTATNGAGALTGAYFWRIAFLVKDADGHVLSHSPYGPASVSLTLASQKARLTNIEKSGDPQVNSRRIARTASGGSTYFEVIDIDDNTTTTYDDDMTDAGINVLPIATLGSGPKMYLVASWKNRLWGVSDVDIDVVRFTEDGLVYAWPATNQLVAGPKGADIFGVTGFLARRDEFGILKRDIIWKIIGTPGTTSLEVIRVVEGTGCQAPDSCIVVRDVGYFLGEDGFYHWSASGVKNLSREKVNPWFTTDTYFNRALFPQAFCRYDPKNDLVELHLAAAGSSVIDRWLSYEITTGNWFGPHRTAAFTPTAATLGEDTNDLAVPLVGGSNGHIYKGLQTGASDDGQGIDYDVIIRHHCNTPDIEKYFGELFLLSRIEAAGTMTITPAIGGLNAADQGTAISANMTLGRQRLRRLSSATQPVGRFCKLRFQHATNTHDCAIYGYEIPFHERGRR